MSELRGPKQMAILPTFNNSPGNKYQRFKINFYLIMNIHMNIQKYIILYFHNIPIFLKAQIIILFLFVF